MIGWSGARTWSARCASRARRSPPARPTTGRRSSRRSRSRTVGAGWSRSRDSGRPSPPPRLESLGSTGNNLALEGETLFMAYAFASSDSGLPTSGGIMAVPTSGAPAVLAATPAPDTTSQWGAGSFWVAGGRLYLADRQRHPVVACRRPHTQHAAGHALVHAVRRLRARCRVRVFGSRREFEGSDGHQDPDRGRRADRARRRATAEPVAGRHG